MDEEKNNGIGVIRELGELPPDTVLSEEALAKIFSWHRVSIKRAVERGELPPSIRMFGQSCWTVGCIREHLAKRLEAAKKEDEQLQRRISQFSA